MSDYIRNRLEYVVVTRVNLGKVYSTMNSMSNEDKWSVPAYKTRAYVNWSTEFHSQRRRSLSVMKYERNEWILNELTGSLPKDSSRKILAFFILLLSTHRLKLHFSS